jgi:hypothetical protein
MVVTAALSPFCSPIAPGGAFCSPTADPFLLLQSTLSCVERILQRSSGRPLRRTWIEFPYGEEEITLLEEEVLPAIQQCLQRVVDAVFRVGEAFSKRSGCNRCRPAGGAGGADRD